MAVRILQPDLLNTIRAAGDGAFFSGPVFEGNVVFFQVGDEIFDRGDAEAGMVVFVNVGFGGSALDEVQLAVGADFEPGVAAVVERFRNGVQAHDGLIEFSAFLEVLHIQGNVIEDSCFSVTGLSGSGHGGKYDE